MELKCEVDSVVFLDAEAFERSLRRELFALVRDALLLLRNSRFHLDLVHDLVGEYLGAVLQCIGLVPQIREDVVLAM